jgi:hypothetical protein
LVTLRNGEKIPSLREALEFTLEETNIKTVWLDTKDVDVVPASIELLTEINERAVNITTKDYLGIPADDIMKNSLNCLTTGYSQPCCFIDQVREANALIWAA